MIGGSHGETACVVLCKATQFAVAATTSHIALISFPMK